MNQSRIRYGFTLIELCIVVVLLAVLAGIALPSYQNLRESQRLTAATQVVYADIMLLKSEAIKRGQPITLRIFNSGSNEWCYRIQIDGTCNSCSDDCATVAGRMGLNAADFTPVVLSASYSSGKLTFSPFAGTMPAGNIQIQNATNFIRVITWNNGRVKICPEGQTSC